MKKEPEFGDYVKRTLNGKEVFARVATKHKPYIFIPYTALMDIGSGLGRNRVIFDLSKWEVCKPPYQNETTQG